MIENVNNELKKYFESKPIISSLLGLDMILLYGCVALMLLNSFVYLGGIISGILLYVLYLGFCYVLQKEFLCADYWVGCRSTD